LAATVSPQHQQAGCPEQFTPFRLCCAKICLKVNCRFSSAGVMPIWVMGMQSLAKPKTISGKVLSRMPIKGRSKIKAIKLAALAAVAIATAGILVLAHFETMRSLLRDEIRHRLMTIATAATMLIDPEEHEKIAHTKDPNDPLYRKTVAKLRTLAQQTLPEVQAKGLKLAREAIYTLVPSTGTTWHFVLDTMLPYDRDGNGKLDSDELPAQIGEALRCFGFS
jgi:hypothetical protein